MVLYAGMAALLLSRGGVTPGDSTFVQTAVWVLFAYFVIGIIMNASLAADPSVSR